MSDEVEDLETVVDIEEETVSETPFSKDDDTPDYLDLEWSDYVLSLLDDTEKFEKRPRVTGLRRICEKILGPVVYSKGHLISESFEYNEIDGQPRPKAVVNYELHIHFWGETMPRVFFGMAESNPLNSDDFSLPFPVACTESRAEGRAYKKAPKLTCLTADEIPQKNMAEAISNVMGTTGFDDSGKKITKTQIRVLNNKCKACDIDVIKFINCNDKYGPYDVLASVEKDVASLMLDKLNKFENDKTLIPKEITK